VASGHDEVSEGGNEGNASGHDVVVTGLAVAILVGTGSLVGEVAGGDEEAEEGKHESLVAMVGELRFTLIGDDGLVVGVGSREGEAKAEEESGDAKVDDKPKDPAPAKTKTKLRKINLEFSIVRPLDWTNAELQKEIEVEVDMANADRIVRETADARNELESYIYDMRDKIISESQLAPYCTEAEKTAFSSLLESFENWLYEDGFDATKSVYIKKIEELKKHGTPIENRQYEARTRPNAMTMLQKTIEKYTS